MKSVRSASPKSHMANLLLFTRKTSFCMTFASQLTEGWAVQLPITQCVLQSHFPSQTLHAMLNATIIAVSSF